MAGWTRIPVSSDDEPQAGEMNEIAAALAERDALAQLSPFSRSGITLPADVAGGDELGALGVRRDALEALLDVDYATNPRVWRAGPDQAFAALWTGSTGSGLRNVFTHAGLAGTDWSRTLDAEVDVRHVNEFRTVLNTVIRAMSLHADPSAGNVVSAVGSLNAAWSTARAGALAAQNGGGGGSLWTPWFGRFAGNLEPASYQVDAITVQRASWSWDTSGLDDRSISAAWVLIEKLGLYAPANAYPLDFNFDVRIGATTLRSLASNTAADHSGVLMFSGLVDVWAVEIDPTSLINPSGTTTVDLVLTTDPLADVGGWNDPADWLCQAFAYHAGGVQGAVAALVIELDNFEYHS